MLFKVLDKDGRSCNGGNLQWSLPTQNTDGSWTAGDWMPTIAGELVPCENGYHLAEDTQVLEWMNEAIYEAEYRGERVNADNKVVVRECRLLRRMNWNERIARLFAVWCAREALKLIHNPDPRSIAACDVAERYANCEATGNELAAAWAAAWDAARDAAWAAAWVAARDAAGVAAWDAARDAAWAAAWVAARDAAGVAAWDARDAAGAAAWAAKRDAQYRHLLTMLEAQA